MKFTPLKLRRLERRLLQIEVAKRAAVPCSRLSAIENGDVEAQPDELQRIASTLGIPAEELDRKYASHRAPTSRTRSVVGFLHPVAARSIAG